MIRKLVLFLVSLILICAVAVASYASPPGILGSGPALAASSSTQIAIAKMTSSLPVAVVEFGVKTYGQSKDAANSSFFYSRSLTAETFDLASMPCVGSRYAVFSPPATGEAATIVNCNAYGCQDVAANMVTNNRGVMKTKFGIGTESAILVASNSASVITVCDNLRGNTRWITLKTPYFRGPIGLVA